MLYREFEPNALQAYRHLIDSRPHMVDEIRGQLHALTLRAARQADAPGFISGQDYIDELAGRPVICIVERIGVDIRITITNL